MPVPLLDLKLQYQNIKEQIDKAIRKVVDSQYFILGPEVQTLEQELAKLCGVEYAVGCASGTDALILSLKALDIKPKDEVITTPFTFIATVGAIANVGAKPVFVDICEDDFNMDPKRLSAAITDRTKAIIVVHLFGQCADMDPIMEIAGAAGVPVIEDAAQAILAGYRGKRAGSMGKMGCFSFFPSKNLGGFGDGGMITTSGERLYQLLLSLRVHGQGENRYLHERIGINSRLDTLQAAVLSAKLPYLEQWTEARRSNARAYNDLLRDIPQVKTPKNMPERFHVFNQYTLRVPNRDGLVEHLKSKGIGHAVYYPIPMHLQQAFSYLGYKEGDFPTSEQASKEVISIPVFPELSERQLAEVVVAIREFYE